MVNINKTIEVMYDFKARGIRYSMNGKRDGSDGTADCSGAIYTALRAGGATNAGWILNTDSMHKWLIQNGFTMIAHKKEWPMKRGDIIIFGKFDPKTGTANSAGAAGHVVIATDGTFVIHCNYGTNGVSVNNENTLPYDMGWTVYRPVGGKTPTTKPSQGSVIDDVIAGKYGDGPVRRKNLTAAGYDPDQIQKDVNERLLKVPVNKDVDKVAREALQGKWGNGDDRIKRLKKAGHDPIAVQKRVNQLI